MGGYAIYGDADSISRVSAAGNYPDGIQEGNPRMPWNQPDEPDWVGFYETIETDLPIAPDTPEDAARYVGNLIETLKHDKRQLEKYAADGCFRRRS